METAVTGELRCAEPIGRWRSVSGSMVLEDVAGLVDGGGAGVMMERAFDLC